SWPSSPGCRSSLRRRASRDERGESIHQASDAVKSLLPARLGCAVGIGDYEAADSMLRTKGLELDPRAPLAQSVRRRAEGALIVGGGGRDRQEHLRQGEERAEEGPPLGQELGQSEQQQYGA